MSIKKNKYLRSQKSWDSFGIFQNFSSLIHGTVKIFHKTSSKKLQQIIVNAFKLLNELRIEQVLSAAGNTSLQKGVIAFEVGIANGLYFEFLNEVTLTKLAKYLQQNIFSIIDVLIIVTYHYFKKEKKIPLNFDHYILRLVFHSKELDLYLYHVKGIRRMNIDEFLNYIIELIKKQIIKHHLKTFNVKYFKTL